MPFDGVCVPEEGGVAVLPLDGAGVPPDGVPVLGVPPPEPPIGVPVPLPSFAFLFFFLSPGTTGVPVVTGAGAGTVGSQTKRALARQSHLPTRPPTPADVPQQKGPGPTGAQGQQSGGYGGYQGQNGGSYQGGGYSAPPQNSP